MESTYSNSFILKVLLVGCATSRQSAPPMAEGRRNLVPTPPAVGEPAEKQQVTAVATAKRDIQWQFRLAEDNLISWAEAYANAQSLSDRYAQRLTVEQEPMLAALERMSSNLGGLEGKKVAAPLAA